jgi:hypothetical protein
MQTIVPWAIWAGLILAVLGVVLILIFGVVSLVRGKTRLISIAIIAIPAVVLGVLWLLGMTWAQAAIWTAVVMFVLGLLGLFAGGVRDVIGV